MSAVDGWVKAANRRLGQGGVRLEVGGKSSNLYLRGTFPPKPWEPNQSRRQRRLALGIRAIAVDDVKRAESIARDVTVALNRGEFDWAGFTGIENPNAAPVTIGDWVKRFEEERRPKISDNTWKYSYQALIDRLPLKLEPTEELLMAWVLEHDPNASTMRRKYLTIARGICELAGISDRRLSKLTKEDASRPINPRELPEDAAIVAMWQSIESIEWQWVYGMLATYGLRPHELFRLDLKTFPDVKVGANTKTGERVVPPLYPRWVLEFGLTENILLPSNLRWDESEENYKVGRKIGMGFKYHGFGDPYNLRHCYARRCLEVGMNSDVAAALLGHSRNIHEKTYRAFVKNSVYVDAAKKIIERAGN